MRIGILTSKQLPTDTPHRYISRSEALNAVSRGILVWIVVKKIAQEIDGRCVPSSDPDRFSKQELRGIPRIHPPQEIESNLMLSYPSNPKGSIDRRNYRDMWKNATQF